VSNDDGIDSGGMHDLAALHIIQLEVKRCLQDGIAEGWRRMGRGCASSCSPPAPPSGPSFAVLAIDPTIDDAARRDIRA
jgi:hypothetical protein